MHTERHKEDGDKKNNVFFLSTRRREKSKNEIQE